MAAAAKRYGRCQLSQAQYSLVFCCCGCVHVATACACRDVTAKAAKVDEDRADLEAHEDDLDADLEDLEKREALLKEAQDTLQAQQVGTVSYGHSGTASFVNQTAGH